MVALVPWKWPAPLAICFYLSVSLISSIFPKHTSPGTWDREEEEGDLEESKEHTLKDTLLNSKFLLISVNLFNSTSAPSAFFTRNSSSCFSLAI